MSSSRWCEGLNGLLLDACERVSVRRTCVSLVSWVVLASYVCIQVWNT